MLLFVIATISIYTAWVLYRFFARTADLNNLRGPPSPFLRGNFGQLFNPREAWKFHRNLAERYGKITRVTGPFKHTRLYVFDPKAMNQIIKDADKWDVSTVAVMSEIVFGPAISGVFGAQHRKQRKMLFPAFSVSHLRQMSPMFYDVLRKLGNAIESQVSNGCTEPDMSKWMSRSSFELICRGGLGASMDPLTTDDCHPYPEAVRQFMKAEFSLVVYQTYVLPWVAYLGTRKFRRFVVDLLPSRRVRKLRDFIDVMYKTMVDAFEEKKGAFEQGDDAIEKQAGSDKNIISILMKANMSASPEDRLTDEEVVAQMSALVFAAMDTTTSSTSRLLHLLALHPEVQERLRSEIKEASQDGADLSYDQLMPLPYLDAVVRETLRLYPASALKGRMALKDVVLPLSRPVIGIDGREMSEIFVPAGTGVYVSIINSNRDPDVWGPDSYEWKPERWLSTLPTSVSESRIPGIYSHLMTFFGGTRSCLGFKFAELTMKVALYSLLLRFRFAPTDKEIEWNMSTTIMPSVRGDPQPRMPLEVSIL